MRPQEIEIIFYKIAETFSSQKKFCINVANSGYFYRTGTEVELKWNYTTAHSTTSHKPSIKSVCPASC